MHDLFFFPAWFKQNVVKNHKEILEKEKLKRKKLEKKELQHICMQFFYKF